MSLEVQVLIVRHFATRLHTSPTQLLTSPPFKGHLGARLYCPDLQSRLLGWLIRTGDDFPSEARNILLGWNTRV